MNNDLMFSSLNQCWATRNEVFNQLNDLFGDFNLDCCAEAETAKCTKFFTKEQDMFKQETWRVNHLSTNVFMNPPYGREQSKFVVENINRIKSGQVDQTTILVPARVCTNLFHNIILPNAKEIIFYEGRLVFGTDEYWEYLWSLRFICKPKGDLVDNPLYNKIGKFNAAPFPSMVVNIDFSSIKSDYKNTTDKPKISTLKAPKFKYKGNMQPV